MNRKTVTLIIILFVCGISCTSTIVYLVFFYPWDKEAKRDRLTNIDKISWEQTQFERLADKLNLCADISYGGSYAYKARRFYLYSLMNDTTVTNDTLQRDVAECLYNALDSALPLNVWQVWNYKADHFYRFDMPWSSDWFPTVYVIKQKTDTAQYFKGVEGMHKISTRIYLKLAKKDF